MSLVIQGADANIAPATSLKSRVGHLHVYDSGDMNAVKTLLLPHQLRIFNRGLIINVVLSAYQACFPVSENYIVNFFLNICHSLIP